MLHRARRLIPNHYKVFFIRDGEMQCCIVLKCCIVFIVLVWSGLFLRHTRNMCIKRSSRDINFVPSHKSSFNIQDSISTSRVEVYHLFQLNPASFLQFAAMSHTDRRIAPGETILVTGANGYIATHIVDVLLEQGYNVRGTVRAEKPWLNDLFDQKYGKGRFETRIVKVLEEETAFEGVLKDVSGIIHTVRLNLLILLSIAR